MTAYVTTSRVDQARAWCLERGTADLATISITSLTLNDLVALMALRCPALSFKEAADNKNSKAPTKNVITGKAYQQVHLVPL
jgi:hypothetical protein